MNDSSSESNQNYHEESPPADEGEIRARHESNRAGWNEGAVRYSEQIEKTIQFIRDGGSSLHPIERANLGSLKGWCKKAIHLQCASGRDTLSLLNEGVEEVVGIDISDVQIQNACLTSAALNAPASWIRCDVLDTPHELDGSADLVYTGRGAMCWLQDVPAWALVVARLLKPGGVFHILDDHPVTWLFDPDAEDLRYSGINYFEYYESGVGWPDSYIGKLEKSLDQQARKYEALWTLADIHQSLVSAGLVIEYLGEHPEDYWLPFPNLKPALRGRIPMTFSLKARKPLSG